jgi:hypothetical protein
MAPMPRSNVSMEMRAAGEQVQVPGALATPADDRPQVVRRARQWLAQRRVGDEVEHLVGQ